MHLTCRCPITSAHPDGKLARDAARPFVAMYMTRMPNIAAEMGFADELLARVRAAVADGGIAAGLPYVTDDMVRAVTVAGTPDECRVRIDDYRAAGVGLPILFPLGDLRHAIDFYCAALACVGLAPHACSLRQHVPCDGKLLSFIVVRFCACRAQKRTTKNCCSRVLLAEQTCEQFRRRGQNH